MFSKKLNKLDIECIMLKLDRFNSIYPEASQNQKEYHLANTLKEFGVKVDYNASGYRYGCVPAPPRLGNCYQPETDVTTSPPKSE